MKTKFLFIIPIMFFSITLHSQDYSDLKSVLNKWADLMTYYSNNMVDCDDLEKLTGYCIELADSITILSPELKEIGKKYPEVLFNEAPPELGDFIKNHMAITEKFSTMTLGLTRMANKYPDNKQFQAAYGKLNTAIYYMNR